MRCFLNNTMRYSLSGVLVTIIFLVSGCRETTRFPDTTYLFKTGGSTISVGDYRDALEVAKVAYTHNELKEPETFRRIQHRLFSQLFEELILMEIAREKKISVSPEELAKEVREFKKSYPEGVLEELLLENAVSFKLWEKSLLRRRLMEKVLEQELDLTIEITPEVIEDYYQRHKDQVDLKAVASSEEAYLQLVKKIRVEKRQEYYQSWFLDKKKDYSIEVNEKVWEKISER